VVLFAIQQLLTISFGHWTRNSRDVGAMRYLLAALVFFFTRAALMGLAVLDSVGVLPYPTATFLYPLERFFGFVTVALAAWAFVPALERHVRLGIVLLVIVLLLAMVGYAASAYLWPDAEAQGMMFNAHILSRVWSVASIGVLALAMAASLLWREGEWALSFFLFGIWLVGYGMQVASPDVDSHTAGWVRLADLAVLPLLAAIVYRRALSVVPAPAGHGDEVLEAVGILQAARRIEEARDIDAALGLAASSVVRALEADMVAIGLPIAGASKGIRVVTLRPATSVMLSQPNLVLFASDHPLLASVLQTGRVERMYAKFHDPAVSTIFHALGFERSGPLILQPFLEGNSLLGVIMVGNPNSRRKVTPRDEQILQAVGAVIATALANARRGGGGGQSVELQEARAEVLRLTEQVALLENGLGVQRQRAEELDTRLRLQAQDAVAQGQDPAEMSIWQEEMRELAEARATLEAELAEWKQKAEQIAHAKADLQIQLAQTRAELQEVQGQAVLPSVPIPVQEPAAAPMPTPPAAEEPVMRPVDGHGPGGILVGDERGNIVLVSQGAQYLVGQPRSSLLGKPLKDLFDEPVWTQTAVRLSSEGAKAGDTGTATMVLDDRTIRAEMTRLPGDANWPGAVTAMLYLEQGSTLQNEMLISLIHELRTPMTSINGYTDLLIGEAVGIVGETQRQFLLRVKANIERMGGLLDDMVKAVAIDTGGDAATPELVDVIKVIESAIMSLSAQFNERNLSVQMDVPPQLPPAYADRDSLYQIVQHLLSNACQCSTPGSEVVVGAQMEEQTDQIQGLPDYVLVSVTDTGGGISPEDQRRVFQRMYRADNPLIAGLGETGVGLSIAKALVEAQGGRIWVESEMGAGSTFSFLLPLSSEDGKGQMAGFSFDPLPLPEELEGSGG
jgi:signal transduction histidine kinase